MPRGLIACSVGKTDALVELAAQAGLTGADPYAADLDGLFAALRAAFGPPAANSQIVFADAASVADVTQTIHFPPGHRPIVDPVYRNGRPDSFPLTTGSETSPAFAVARIAGGVFAHVARAPVALLPDRCTVVRDHSSRYAPLVHFYDADLARMLSGARRVEGTVLALSDDIFPINYCHWMVDTLPRLAFLGERRDVTILVNDQDADYRRESLRLCGFDGDRVLVLEDFAAVQADTLLVPRDSRDMPHPAHKAAPWVFDFLRARIGFAALATPGPRAMPRKLYVSRADTGGRRVLNEAALMRLLEPLGYHRVTLAGTTLSEQVALFAGATHVVGLHGAGLANIAFSPAGASLLEIFPASYGMATYYVLAAGQGLAYASYIAADVRAGARTQIDDVVVDVADFARCCGDFL